MSLAVGQARPATAVDGMPRSVVDPKGGPERGRNILVVTTVERPGERLRRHIGPDDLVKVVVPAVHQGFLDWLANDQGAFAHAEEIAAETAEQLPGHTVRSSAGEADVELAIRDALATFPADEIVVAVRSDDDAGRVLSADRESARADSRSQREIPEAGYFVSGRSFAGIPVRLVVVADA